jgi:hypothetical protein
VITVADLREILRNFPDDAPVWVSVDDYVGPVDPEGVHSTGRLVWISGTTPRRSDLRAAGLGA